MSSKLNRTEHRYPGPASLAALFALALLATLGVGSLASPPPAEAIKTCPDVLFLGARGSGEAANVKESNMGPAVDAMADRLQGHVLALGETFDARGIDYQAAPVELLYPSKAELAGLIAAGWTGGASAAAAVLLWRHRHLAPYLASIDEGIGATIKAVGRATDRCPETELVLAGYSQGAMVIHQAELRLDDELLAAIGGTLLLGDGDRVPRTEAKRIGGSQKEGKGVRTYTHLLKHSADVAEPETSVEICVAGDVVCDFSLQALKNRDRSIAIHTSFSKNPRSKSELRQAVDWLAREMGLID